MKKLIIILATIVSITTALAQFSCGAGFCNRGIGSYTPRDLGSNLRAWYPLDTLTGSNGDPQSTIVDASGNGFNLTATGALRCTLALGDLNSLNTCRWTAANLQRYILDVNILSGSIEGSIYFVQKVVSVAAQNGSSKWGSSVNQTYTPFSDGIIYDDFGATVRKTVGTPTAALTSYRIISLYSASADWAYFVDGGTGGSGGGTTALFSTGTNTVGWAGSNVAFGATADLSAFFDGWYAEVIYTNAKQSTLNRQKTEGYLACKWGLQGNFSASHPYKSTCPLQ